MGCAVSGSGRTKLLFQQPGGVFSMGLSVFKSGFVSGVGVF